MPSPTDENREELIQFLRDVHALMDGLIAEGTDPFGRRLFDPDILSMLQEAWGEFNEQFQLDRAADMIRATSDDRLEWAGLYGAQLSLKLAVISRLRDRFASFGGGGILKKLLDAIDRLLESLIAATGIDEALKELKEILSDSIEEGT